MPLTVHQNLQHAINTQPTLLQITHATPQQENTTHSKSTHQNHLTPQPKVSSDFTHPLQNWNRMTRPTSMELIITLLPLINQNPNIQLQQKHPNLAGKGKRVLLHRNQPSQKGSSWFGNASIAEAPVEIRHETHLGKPTIYFSADDYFVNLANNCKWLLWVNLSKEPTMKVSQFQLKGRVEIGYYNYNTIYINFL